MDIISLATSSTNTRSLSASVSTFVFKRPASAARKKEGIPSWNMAVSAIPVAHSSGSYAEVPNPAKYRFSPDASLGSAVSMVVPPAGIGIPIMVSTGPMIRL